MMKSRPAGVEYGTLRLMVIVIKRSAAVMGRERFQTKSQVSCNFLLDFQKPFISLMWASGNFSCFVIVPGRHDTYASRIARLLFIGRVSISFKVGECSNLVFLHTNADFKGYFQTYYGDSLSRLRRIYQPYFTLRATTTLFRLIYF